jgi:pimeloyl-ACP methyl ester carboxylesterase
MTDSAASNEPILLFLHGVGDGDQNDNWKVALSESLAALGYPTLDQIQTIAPKYAHALKGWDDGEPLPALTLKQPSGEVAKQNRRDFERRMGAIEFRLGRHNHGNGLPGGDAIIDAAVAVLPTFDQARNYLKEAFIRAQVLNRILAKLPKTGRIVILGHSLGSVVAADLVPRLPVGLEVVGMVTIGSPLANGTFEVDKLRETLKDPPTNLAWWVNFWNTSDMVSAHRGVSSVFPWMIDFRIDTKNRFPQAHFAVNYLAHEAAAAAIGFALFGSRSKELAEINTGVDIALDYQERTALLALRYAHLRKMRLEGDQKDRFTGALRQVQATAIDEIKRRNAGHDRPLASEIALLAFDVTDPQATLPEPQPSRFFTKDQAVVLLTVLAAENVIRPFEITISRDKWQETMEELAAEMGLTSRFGTDVFTAAGLAQEALGDKKGVNWVKWGAIGVGAAAIVVATGGLALAAAPGLVGAAVVTSALASFGPGGMIGGLLMAGTLVTAGGGGIAYGLASPGTTAETLEAIVERRLAAALLRKLQHLEQDPAVWRVLAEAEIEVRREYERLDEFSDESSPVLKELKRKITTIERALKCLKDNGLEPTVPVV